MSEKFRVSNSIGMKMVLMLSVKSTFLSEQTDQNPKVVFAQGLARVSGPVCVSTGGM